MIIIGLICCLQSLNLLACNYIRVCYPYIQFLNIQILHSTDQKQYTSPPDQLWSGIPLHSHHQVTSIPLIPVTFFIGPTRKKRSAAQRWRRRN